MAWVESSEIGIGGLEGKFTADGRRSSLSLGSGPLLSGLFSETALATTATVGSADWRARR